MADNRKSATQSNEPKTIWDNDLPAGNSPPIPKAPLIAAAVAYAGWLVFLVVMTVLRLTYKA
jgi:hypothetical protein